MMMTSAGAGALAMTGAGSAAIAISLLTITSVACLLVLRGARFPVSGRAVVAGMLAGLLLGPTIFGRVMPDAHESLFVGGQRERSLFDAARRVVEHPPPPLMNMNEHDRATLQADVDAREHAFEAARWRDQRPMRVFAMAVIALMMLLAGAMGTIHPAAGDARQNWVTPASIGLWSFALPAAFTYIIAMSWWNTSIAEAALLAAAVGIGPLALAASIEREIADRAEVGGARMMQSAGRVASVLAIVLAVWMMWQARGAHGIEAALLATPLLALPLSWLVASRRSAASAAAPRAFVIECLLAIVSALVAIRVDVLADFAIWPLLAIGLLCDDGRWLGAFLGALLPGGRPALRSMRLVMPAMACGPTQLAVAALALWGGFIPDRYALPLLAGAMLVETTAPARRFFARQLIEAEMLEGDGAGD